MLRFILSRLLGAIPTLILVAVTIFVLMRMVPGDPATLMLGDMADPDQVAAMRRSMGLDDPVWMQFLTWAGQILRGDFGTSIVLGDPVLPLILDRFSVSASIVMAAIVFAVAVAVPLGMLAAWHQNSIGDLAAVGGATLLLSIPSFWMGLMLLLAFGLKLGWLPIVGYVPFGQDALAAARAMILPVVTIVLVEIGSIIRMARASMIEVSRLEYITHARAKGVSEGAVLLRHALPNAFAPTWTLIGLVLGNLLGGIAVVETVFTLPGLGRLLVDAIFARDYPVIQGCMLFTAVIYVVVNLIVDLCYPLFDPRVMSE